jgi:hypothetical protein
MGAVCTNCRDTKDEEKGNQIESHVYRDSNFSLVRGINNANTSDAINGGNSGLYVKTVDYVDLKQKQCKQIFIIVENTPHPDDNQNIEDLMLFNEMSSNIFQYINDIRMDYSGFKSTFDNSNFN